MSTTDITNTGPKGSNDASMLHSTQAKSTASEHDLSDDLGGMKINVEEKTPTQDTTSQAKRSEADSDGVNTPTPASATLAIPGTGLMRKSASSMTLGASAADDVFAPGPEATSSAPPYQLATSASVEPNTISERIRAGYLSLVPPGAYLNHGPRADRGQEVNVHNVQGVWPADAVVFVANLSAQRTQDQLEIACKNIFDIFGSNFVKVKYDKNKHPFALVSFETTEAAIEAIRNNQGAVLDGRTIRLEQGKAERAVILTKNNGTSFTDMEARAVLEPFGALDAIYPTYALRGRIGTLPGYFVRFVYYQDCRDALRALSGAESPFRLQLATGVEENARQVMVPAPVPVPQLGPARPTVHSNTDIKSVFVGNLPQGTTKQDLVNIFSEHGNIIDCNVITKRYEGGSVNVFGFVEYPTNQEAEDAAYTEKFLGGKKLRIEPKEYTARRGNRLNQGMAPSTHAVPTPARSPRRTPRRLTPQANNALSSRLAANNVENFGNVFTPGPTPPQHLLPSNLFSPSPPSYYQLAPQYGGGYHGQQQYYDQYGNSQTHDGTYGPGGGY